jgi:CDGSH-type Zn-finger protein/truncated hemoglobin YjbI
MSDTVKIGGSGEAGEPGEAPAAQGGLARVIATRGGKAEPEAPFVIEHREALIYMLCEAAELEHGIMCQYLFAAFSMKQSTGEGLTDDELAKVTSWRKRILHVATQEMLHLALVQNLLSAIGAAPHMTRPNLPHPAGHYPAGVQLALLPFGEDALRHFMFLERPEGMDLEDTLGQDAHARAIPHMTEYDIVPTGQDFATVGHLYRSIEEGFRHLTAKYGERWVFVGPPRAQATERHFGWRELVPVTGLDSAQRAIDEILEQGEGPRGHWQNAHFGQFVEILDEFQQTTAANPGFDPVRPVLAANVRPCRPPERMPLITDPLTAQVTDLFNVGYEIMLQIFERFFAHTEETDAELKTLADTTVSLMFSVIEPLADLITTLPAGPDYPGRTAAPSFELFYESDYLMPHRAAAWALLAERLDQAAALATEIGSGPGEQIAGRLAPVTGALTQLAAGLAAYLPEDSPQGQRATAATQPDGTAAALARATQLVTIVATDSPDLAPRLVDSLLRPLSFLMTIFPNGDHPSTASAATSAAPAGQIQAQLWQAAQAATRLHAELASSGGCPVRLTEATAIVQSLACGPAAMGQLTAAEAAARRAELRQLTEALPATVQAAPNGPYLVTNVPHVRNHLGEELDLPPQLALCRCGGSASKPHCDGDCASNGFTDAKDPNRVPDRRDTYPGQEVTIFDNRGLCQHAGFCTDRLATVFRAGQEPFVAPSGGRMDEIIRAVRDCPSGALSFAIDGHEARGQADWGSTREPAIEITKDGPYRITGGVAVTGPDGQPVARNAGASTEHCALCRCGHSQNKPFCSGMHWYIGFTDPPPSAGPTLFEWAGGLPALTRMTRLLYEKHVPADPELAAAFAGLPAGYAAHEARRIGEIFGGPSAAGWPIDGWPGGGWPGGGWPGGGWPGGGGAGRPALTEDQRARWVALASTSATEAGLPADPEFRAALASYLEWDSRQPPTPPAQPAAPAEPATPESQAAPAQPAAATRSAEPTQPGQAADAGQLAEPVQPGQAAEPARDAQSRPMPRWDWSPAGPPSTTAAAGQDSQQAQAAQAAQAATVTLPGPGEPVSFAAHIKPLFREKDRQSMSFAFDLWSVADVRTHAAAILDRLRNGSMPCDTTWPQDWIDTFDRWTQSGTPD